MIEPSRWLFDKYAVPVTHCNTSRQPKFPDGTVCDHPLHFREICDETEMGYLNRMVLQNATTIDGQPFDMDRSAQIGRTLHPFYTVLKNEFVFQPPPGQRKA